MITSPPFDLMWHLPTLPLLSLRRVLNYRAFAIPLLMLELDPIIARQMFLKCDAFELLFGLV